MPATAALPLQRTPKAPFPPVLLCVTKPWPAQVICHARLGQVDRAAMCAPVSQYSPPPLPQPTPY